MKKGIVPLWFSLFFAFLAVALLLLFYFIFLRGDRAPDQIAVDESLTASANNIMINYLNSPVAVGGETVTFADLIRLWYNDKQKYEALLKSATKLALPKESSLFILKEPTLFGTKETTINCTYWVDIYESGKYWPSPYLFESEAPYNILNKKTVSTPVAVSDSKTVGVMMSVAETRT